MDIIKLEKKHGKETERLWKERIDSAIKWRKDSELGDKMMENAMRRFRGKHWDFDSQTDHIDTNSDNPNERITVNLTGSTVQDFIPFLVRTKPKFELHPTSLGGVESSKSASAYMNWVWREYRMQKQYRRAVQDGLVTGRGVVKTGYNFELETEKDASGRVLYNDNIRVDAPYIARVDPRRFYFEPSAAQFDLESARWCFEILFQTWQDVVENPQYMDAVRRDIKSGKENPETISDYLCKVDRDTESEDDMDITQSQQLVVLYEVWDKKFDQYWIFAGNIDRPLMHTPNPYPYLDGFPYTEWRYQELNDEVGSLGIPMVMKDQQDELNRVRTTEFNHRRRYGMRKWQIIEDGVNEDEISKMLDADSEYFYTNHADGARPHDSPALPPDNYQVDRIIQEDIRQLTGQDELQRGGTMPSRTSAREIAAREKVMGTKTAGRTALVDEFLDGVGRQVFQHSQANMETNQIVPITGNPTPEGNLWLEVSPDDIKHEFAFKFTSTSKSETSPAQEKADRQQIYDRAVASAPLMAQQGKQIDLAEMFKWTLEPFEAVELDRFFIDPPEQPVDVDGDGQPDTPGMASPAGPNPNAEQSQVFAGSVQPGSRVGQ